METKTLAFDVSDIEGFKEFFPDYKSGKMTGRDLGRTLLEMLKNQTLNAGNPSNQATEDELRQLKHDFVELQNHCNQLEAQLAETNESPLNHGFQRETQDSINVKNELHERIQRLLNENQQLKDQFQDVQSQKKTLENQFRDFQNQKGALENRINDLKAQLKEALNHQDAYAFTPYFKQLIEVMTAKINDISKTTYSTTDVIMQSLFATYFNSHTSIRYTYPMSKAELLALAQQYYPELRNEKELFNLMIHKIKEEDV